MRKICRAGIICPMDTTKQSSIQVNILYLAKEQGLSIDELNRKAGLGGGVVKNILAGRSRHPRSDTLKAIADVFGVTVEFLMGDQSEAAKRDPEIYDPDTEDHINKLVNDFIRERNLALPLEKVRRFKKSLYSYAKKSTEQVPKHLIEWYLTENL